MTADVIAPAAPRIRPGMGLLLAAGLPAAIVAGLAGLMELAKRLDWLPVTVPAPSEIGAAFVRSGDDLFYHMTPTVLSALAGYGIAILIAGALASLVSAWRRARRTVLTFGVIVDSIPLIALTPILMLWLGNGVESRIVIATVACLFPLLVGAVQGLTAIDRSRQELFHVLSASRWQRLRKLALPSALPYLFAAMKIAAPLAVLGALIAEWVNAERGLGIMMVYALFSFDVPLVWLTIIAVCALAMIGYALIAIAERLVVTWDGGGRIGADPR